MADAPFPAFESLKLGHVDDFPERGEFDRLFMNSYWKFCEYYLCSDFVSDESMSALGWLIQCNTRIKTTNNNFVAA